MAIDKFVPRQLNTDVDQRYLQEGEMIDAINISFNEDGPNSQVVLKNERGTQTYLAATVNDVVPDYPMTVIGSVSDVQRRRIYFFAAANVENSESYDIIFMLDMEAQLYSIVFRSLSNRTSRQSLNFDPNSFIKADVLNRDIQRNDTIQSILFFTDNINPPRKINVDRALAGDYQEFVDGTATEEFDFVFNVAVGAPTRNPTFVFETDEDLGENNLKGRCFQFATQFVYVDGEESAISPYSSLAFVDEASEEQVLTSGAPVVFASPRNRFNVCAIDTKFSNNNPFVGGIFDSVLTPEVVELRLLGREDNDGAWFVIDEFDPREDLVKTRTDNIPYEYTVYDANTGLYRFTNNSSYRTVPSITTDKLYDNVPRLARGQAISGNRLVYSNYLEGYNSQNTDLVREVLITPVYPTGDEGGADSEIGQGFANWNGSAGEITVDWNGIFSNQDPDEGSSVGIELTWNVGGDSTVTNNDAKALIQFEGVDSEGARVVVGRGGANQGFGFDDVDIGAGSYTFNFNYTVQAGDTINDVSNAFANYVQEQSWANYFTKDNILLKSLGSDEDIAEIGNESSYNTSPYEISPDGGDDVVDVTQTWKFTGESTGGVTTITPGITFMSAYGEGDYATYNVSGGGTPGGGPGGFDPGGVDGIGGGGFDGETEGDLEEDWWNIQFQSEDFAQNPSGEVYTWSGTNVSAEISTTSKANAVPSFKAGSTHEFGLMYYDEYNRNGPFISLGSSYARSLRERQGIQGRGAVGFNFTFPPEVDGLIPEWARSYKILYGGSQFQSVFTGTVANAFVATDAIHQGDPGGTAPSATASEYDEGKRHIYVSIQNIEDMQSEMDVKTSYDFAEGDILRVTSYWNAADGEREYPFAGSSSEKKAIEFEVVKTVIFEDDYNNPLRVGTYNQGDLRDNGKVGRFLVLRAPEVDAGLLQYPGFDWFSIAETQNTDIANPVLYPDGTTQASELNYWKQECVVEILSPRKNTDRRLFYEITDYVQTGIRRSYTNQELQLYGQHGRPIVTFNGDMFFRPSISNINSVDTSGQTPIWSSDPKDRIYKSIPMESDRFSDKRSRTDWGKGRAHIPLKDNQQRRRINGITYSEAVVADLNTLYTSSFDKNQNNYLDLNASYGAVNYIGSMGENLMALQENKVSRLSVDRQVVKSAGGADVALALAASPFNVDIYFSGDYGVGNNPESVLIQDSQLFFADVSRSAICRLASSQLYPISEKNTKNLFNNRFNTFRAFNNGKIVSGYNPDTDMYYVTFLMGDDSDTIGYSVFGGTNGEGAWISRYTFYPTNYANQDNYMLSTLYYDPSATSPYDQQLFHRHSSNNYNTFYGQFAQSDFTYVSKMDPSRVKVYDVISHEGNSNNWVVQSINTNLMGANDNAGTLAFVEREGSYFAYITRDPGGSKHVRMLGRVDSSTFDSITFQNRINNMSVPANAELMLVLNGSLVSISSNTDPVLVESLTDSKTVAVQTPNIDVNLALNGNDIALRTPAILDSDPIRGHYATIRMTNGSPQQFELYCVNTLTTPSQLHHNRG